MTCPYPTAIFKKCIHKSNYIIKFSYVIKKKIIVTEI